MKVNYRHYILIVLAIFTSVITFSGYFFLYKHIISQTENFSRVSKIVGAETERKQNEKELFKIYEDTKDDRARIISSFIKEDKVVLFIEKVENIADDSGAKVELSSISTKDEIIYTHVDINGSWGNVMRALTMIENLPYNVSVNGVRLDAQGAGTAKSSWRLILDLKAITIT